MMTTNFSLYLTEFPKWWIKKSERISSGKIEIDSVSKGSERKAQKIRRLALRCCAGSLFGLSWISSQPASTWYLHRPTTTRNRRRHGNWILWIIELRTFSTHFSHFFTSHTPLLFLMVWNFIHFPNRFHTIVSTKHYIDGEASPIFYLPTAPIICLLITKESSSCEPKKHTAVHGEFAVVRKFTTHLRRWLAPFRCCCCWLGGKTIKELFRACNFSGVIGHTMNRVNLPPRCSSCVFGEKVQLDGHTHWTRSTHQKKPNSI